MNSFLPEIECRRLEEHFDAIEATPSGGVVERQRSVVRGACWHLTGCCGLFGVRQKPTEHVRSSVSEMNSNKKKKKKRKEKTVSDANDSLVVSRGKLEHAAKNRRPILVVVHLGAKMLFGIPFGRPQRRSYGHVGQGHVDATRLRFLNSKRVGPFGTTATDTTACPGCPSQFRKPHHFSFFFLRARGECNFIYGTECLSAMGRYY